MAAFKTLLKIFESWKKLKKKTKKDDNNIERNNRKRFCESSKTLCDLAAKNAEQISGDRLGTENAKKEDVAILHDQRNARKMQMSTLDYVSREKWHKKRQRAETKNLKIPQALYSKTETPTANPIYLQDSSHSESDTSGREFSPCSSKRIQASNQTVSVQLPTKMLHSKTLTQVADNKKSLITNHYFSAVASMINVGSINNGFFSRFKNFQKLFQMQLDLGLPINQVSVACLVVVISIYSIQ